MDENEIADEIAQEFKSLEDLASNFAGRLRRLANHLDKQADAQKISTYKRAPGMSAMNAAIGGVGQAQSWLHEAHKQAEIYDPRPKPRTGDGK